MVRYFREFDGKDDYIWLMVDRKRKLQGLIICCILIVGTLSSIQYYLIRNTYDLIKRDYYREVTLSMQKVLSLPVVKQIKDSSIVQLKKEFGDYPDGQLDSKRFMKDFRAYTQLAAENGNALIKMEMKKYSNLNGMVYKSQFEEIVLKTLSHTDTVLSGLAVPVLISGQPLPDANHLARHHWSRLDEFSTESNFTSDSTGNQERTVMIKGASYIDISNWQLEVFKRMAGIFILAISLILAIIFLFYWMIRTMIEQKKIADMKTDFANNITHELKTPLSSVNIITKSLEKKEFRDQPLVFDELLDALKRQHKKIHHIVDTVMDSAMHTEETAALDELHVNDFLSDYLKGFPVGNRKLEKHIEETEVILKTDYARLEAILNNLIENALKYSDERLPVYCSSFIADETYIIEIRDFGIGIHKIEQARIFDQFYRVPQKDRHDNKGLGLGLYLCRKNAGLIGAVLTVTSKPDHGSVFTLKLPLIG